MNNNGTVSFLYSWPVIILALCIFWPVGLYLMIKRISIDKTAVVKNSSGKGLKITGTALIVLGGLGIMDNFSSFNFGNFILYLFFIAGGIVLVNKAKKIQAEGESIKQYLAIVVNGHVRQLDAIASATGKSYDVVHNDIKNMIDKGFFKNAYINEGSREIVLPNTVRTTQNIVNTTANVANVAPVQPRIVACPCCGANNTVLGNIGECEYCGSPLK